MGRTLVIGGAGYVGGAVTDALALARKEFTVYDNLTYEHAYTKPVHFVYGDIRNKKKLLNLMKDYDTVIWLAAIVGDGACQADPEIATEINQEMVSWLAENYNGKIVFTSTCSCYGANRVLLTEDSPTNPLSVYASTKLKAEEYLKDKNAIIFRLGTVYGISDTYSRPRFDLVLNIMTLRAVLYQKLTIFGGEQYRPIIHVKDVARAIVQSLVNDVKPGLYNLHETNIKISDLADKVASIIPRTRIEKTEMPFEDARNYSVISDKFRKLFGWSPEYTPEYGIKEIALLISENRIRDLEDIRFSNQAYIERNKEILRERTN